VHRRVLSSTHRFPTSRVRSSVAAKSLPTFAVHTTDAQQTVDSTPVSTGRGVPKFHETPSFGPSWLLGPWRECRLRKRHESRGES
jgi:hypothetical protein